MSRGDPGGIDLVAAYLDRGACLVDCMRFDDWSAGRRFDPALKGNRTYCERTLWFVPLEIARTLLEVEPRRDVTKEGWAAARLAIIYQVEFNPQ